MGYFYSYKPSPDNVDNFAQNRVKIGPVVFEVSRYKDLHYVRISHLYK